MNENLSSELFQYINRHVNGLIKIGKTVKSVSLDFQVLEHFGKGILRFYIHIELNNYDEITNQEKIDIHKYFYNSAHLSGVEYYSLTYKRNNCGIDLDKIQAFSYGYTFAKEIIENIVYNILENSCSFSYKELLDAPLFQLMNYYLRDTQPEFHNRSFEKKYREIYNRSFEFDHSWQLKLLKKSKEHVNFNFITFLREKDLINIPNQVNQSLRFLLINSNIPFKFSYNNFLIIDRNLLKEEILKTKDDSFEVLLKHLD